VEREIIKQLWEFLKKTLAIESYILGRRESVKIDTRCIAGKYNTPWRRGVSASSLAHYGVAKNMTA